MKTNLVFILLWSFAAHGQTLINLKTQTKSPDFSAMTGTKPVQVGPALPATCTLGQLFYNTSAQSGANLYGCTAANVWNSLGGGSSAGGASNGQVLYDSNGTVGGLTVGNVCLTMSGTVLDVNSALCPTRQIVAQGSDTTCAIVSGSSSAYAGGAMGNAMTTYSQGMRVLTQVDVTTSGGAITLDCGAGAKPVYQNDGASTPTTSQWASGAQVLISYDGTLNSGTGGWRILSAGVAAATQTTDHELTRYYTASGAQGGNGAVMASSFYAGNSGCCYPAPIFGGSPSMLEAISLRASGSPDFLQWQGKIPDAGWTGAINVRVFWTISPNNNGSGTGSHAYQVACGLPNLVSGPSFSTAANVAFNMTFSGGATGNYQTGQIDTPTPTVPTCHAGDIVYIRMTRTVTGTATDSSMVAYFDVGFPRLVQ